MLGQIYALLFPQNLDKLILAGAFSSADQFNEARKDYVARMLDGSGIHQDFDRLRKSDPKIANLLLKWSVEEFYSFTGRTVTIPKMIKSISKLIKDGKRDQAIAEINPNHFVMDSVLRGIGCNISQTHRR